MTLFAAVQIIVIGTGLAFCFVGAIVSQRRRRREQKRRQAYDWAASLILDGGPELERASDGLARLHPTLLAEVLQPLAADTDGEALRRIRVVAQHAGLAHRLQRMSRKRSWKERIRAAHLLMLLADDAPERRELLADPNPWVRARAIETIGVSLIGSFADEFVEALGDPNVVVRSATQHALSIGGSACVPSLIGALEDALADRLPIKTALLLVELASEIPDPRLAEPLLRFIDHPDPQLRRLTASCLGVGVIRRAEDALAQLLEDPEPDVRAEAAKSIGLSNTIELASAVGRLLGDRHWQVRREAGAALALLGPIGYVLLRTHLHDDDAFASDMARHVLEQLEGFVAGPTERIAA